LSSPFEVTLAARTPESEMIAGMIWDASQGQDFAADIVGVTPLVPRGTSDAAVFIFDVDLRSTPPRP
jgi:hypothetical protein